MLRNGSRMQLAAAVLAAYVWLILTSLWVVEGPLGNAVVAPLTACWLGCGLWVWERCDYVNDPGSAASLLFRFAYVLLYGALALCVAAPLAAVKAKRNGWVWQ